MEKYGRNYFFLLILSQGEKTVMKKERTSIEISKELNEELSKTASEMGIRKSDLVDFLLSDGISSPMDLLLTKYLNEKAGKSLGWSPKSGEVPFNL